MSASESIATPGAPHLARGALVVGVEPSWVGRSKATESPVWPRSSR